MIKINEMTMSEILAEAEKRGFDISPYIGKYHHWNDGPEVAAIEHLQSCGSDLFEETDED